MAALRLFSLAVVIGVALHAADADAGAPYATLEVPGWGDAVVSLPDDVGAPRPVVVALHGHRDRPEWHCARARRIFGGRAFVLCPRGVPTGDASDVRDARFTYEDADAASREIDAAMDALARAYPDRADTARPVFFGHSLGAYLGTTLVALSPDRFARVLLNEGGWGFRVPGGPATSGVRDARVLFACGTEACDAGAEASARTLERAGVRAKVVYAAGSGHVPNGAMLDAVRGQLDWFLEGDRRFGER